jgi:hypothetical protein
VTVGYLDPNTPDPDLNRRRHIERDKADADDLARQVLFSGQSTYNGSSQALAKLASRAGKPLQEEARERPGTASEEA